MTADLTPARCGSTAVHPPHPIDGASPGVADCDGLQRRATDTEIAQANAYADEVTGDWERDAPDFESARQGEFEHALEVLIHANGGRWAEPVADVAQAADDAYAQAVKLGAAHGDAMDAAVRAVLSRQVAPALDPLVTAVLDAAIVLAQGLEGADLADLSDHEHRLIAAIDAMLAARHTDSEAPLNRSGSPLPAERAGLVLADAPTGPGGSGEPPATPAADLADEAAHERVARAIHDAMWDGGSPDGFNHPGELTYRLAKVAIDALGPEPFSLAWQNQVADDRAEQEAAIQRLADGLRARWSGDLDHDTADPQAIVSAALAHIDRLTTALDEAARDTHEAVELEAVYDGGLSTDQEIRARALDAATRTLDGAELSGPPGQEQTVRDYEMTTIGTAGRYAEWITEGVYDWTQGTREQRAYVDGYQEAIRRLRDAPDEVDGREDFALHLEYSAPDPDDPWADAAPTKPSPLETWITQIAPGIPLEPWQRDVLRRISPAVETDLPEQEG